MSPLRYGAVFRGNGVVGLPVSLCVGRFPTTAIQVSITPPRGRTHHDSRPVIQAGATGVGVDLLVVASPPYVRYEITDEHGTRLEAASPATAVAPTPSAHRVAPRRRRRRSCSTLPPPRLTNLTSMDPTVRPGRRLQFGAAGKEPLSTFQVAIFGPFGKDSSGDFGLPLRDDDRRARRQVRAKRSSPSTP